MDEAICCKCNKYMRKLSTDALIIERVDYIVKRDQIYKGDLWFCDGCGSHTIFTHNKKILSISDSADTLEKIEAMRRIMPDLTVYRIDACKG